MLKDLKHKTYLVGVLEGDTDFWCSYETDTYADAQNYLNKHQETVKGLVIIVKNITFDMA